MNLFWRRRRDQPETTSVDAVIGPASLLPFACSTCGRTDLPEAGDWDPPICEECDAAINFDAILEEMDEGV